MTRRNRIRSGLFVTVFIVMTAIVVASYVAPSIDTIAPYVQSSGDLERKTIDTRFSIRGDKRAPSNVVIVGIDSKTFTDLQYRWPFPRAYHAKLVRRLTRDGAKAILLDIQFTEPSELGSEDDDALLRACRASGKCVLATTEVNPSDEGEKTQIFGGSAGLRFARAVPAFSEIPNDPDGVRRKFTSSDLGLKTFAVVAYEQVTGKKVDPGSLGGTKAYIDYMGPPRTFQTVSYSNACGCAETKPAPGFKDARVESAPPQLPKGFFKDKIVWIGATAPVLQDVHPTPYGNDNLMPGVEIHANAYQTVAEDFHLKDTAAWFDILVIVALGAIAPFASIRLKLWGVGLAVLAALVYTVATQLAFDSGWIVSYTYPIAAILLTSVGAVAVHYLTEAFERARVRENFARFVPESVVGEVLEQSDGARLGGVSRYATVMFSDLRGFTSFAEQLEPDQVIRILNRYLTVMVDDAIIPNGGTLVDYMGDGIMAVFGAPIEMADHTDRALAAARAKLKRLEEFNAWMHDEYGFDKSFRMGIGLNSGPVMSGNVGSEQRLAYTAIGDTTNTAARLEGMTKGSDLMLFMSDSTKQALSEEPADLAFVGEYEIRGRLERVSIWSIEASRKEKEGDGAFASVARTETLVDK